MISQHGRCYKKISACLICIVMQSICLTNRFNFYIDLPQSLLLWGLPSRLRLIHLRSENFLHSILWIFPSGSHFLKLLEYLSFFVLDHPWIVELLMAACAKVISFMSMEAPRCQLILASGNLKFFHQANQNVVADWGAKHCIYVCLRGGGIFFGKDYQRQIILIIER